MSNIRICIRSLSSQRSLLRPDRFAKPNKGAFESHLDSATSKFRKGDDNKVGSEQKTAASETDNVFVVGGRLKRDNVQPTNNENATVHRSQGRIVRTNDETNTVGGSVAAQMSATAKHRHSRMKNEDDVIVSNPSQLTIPVSKSFADDSTQSMEDSNSMNTDKYNQVQNDKLTDSTGAVDKGEERTPAGVGFFVKLFYFVAGTSAGAGFSMVYAVENSIY